MTFASWKKRSTLVKRDKHFYEVEELCLAAFKAGEREGLKRGEEIAKRAIELREMLVKPKCCEGGPQWGHAWDCKKCPD